MAQIPIIMVTADHERAIRYAALDAGVNDFVEKPVDPREFIARVGTLLALQDSRKDLDARVADLTLSLREQERTTRDHAVRLEALWRIATNPLLEDDEVISAVLTQSADVVRPGERFIARLFRLDGSDAVLEAACDKRVGIDIGTLPLGSRIPLAESNIGAALERGAAIAWDDIAAVPHLNALKRLKELRLRSQIHVPLRAGGSNFVLTYSSRQPTQRPFDSDDLSYVTIVAAFLQARYQQRWQAERIQYQTHFDSLTGIMNRARFRVLARAACTGDGGSSLAIVDLIDFSGVNQRAGNLTGDALLVEVAAALAAVAQDGEFVGRLGGDTFGVCLPGAHSAPALLARLKAYLAVFELPFSTGDRAGIDFVHLGARIGATLAGDVSFNDLLSRADTAIKACRTTQQSRIVIFEQAVHAA
jgi:diguanylate cyclase (GGDEF)-like protein